MVRARQYHSPASRLLVQSQYRAPRVSARQGMFPGPARGPLLPICCQRGSTTGPLTCTNAVGTLGPVRARPGTTRSPMTTTNPERPRPNEMTKPAVGMRVRVTGPMDDPDPLPVGSLAAPGPATTPATAGSASRSDATVRAVTRLAAVTPGTGGHRICWIATSPRRRRATAALCERLELILTAVRLNT